MKRSKKFIVRFLLEFTKNYLPKKVYSLILFLRSYKKFNKEKDKPKTSIKFSENLDNINQYEYKITSQNNEDGIIEYIFSKISNNKYFVEIGFDLHEFNSLNLIKNNWNGLLIDANKEECIALQTLLKYFYPKSKTITLEKRILKDNINKIISLNKKEKIIDFFSLDIDGNDYWILKNLDLDNINVICCEYNHWLGNNIKKTIPYNPEHEFKNDGYFGASLLAIDDLLNSKGFCLVAVESAGTNAFYVRKKFSKYFEILSPINSWRSVGRFETETDVNNIKNKIENSNFVEV